MTPTAPTVADATHAVIAHIRAHGGVSFVEIEQVIARLGIPTQGDRGLFATGIDPKEPLKINFPFWPSRPGV